MFASHPFASAPFVPNSPQGVVDPNPEQTVGYPSGAPTRVVLRVASVRAVSDARARVVYFPGS